MKCLIVDDEKLARSLVREYVEALDEFDTILEAKNGSQAVELINQEKPDLVFLDVQMPDLNGFQVVQQVDFQPAIIFTTAYDQYALKAFEAHAIDYLLKPLNEERFKQAVGKAVDQVHLKQKPSLEDLMENVRSMMPENFDSHFIVQKSNKMINLAVKDIMYLEASGDYSILHSKEGKEYVSSKTLSKLEIRLDPQQFIRIHRSTIINISYLKEVERHASRGMTVVMEDEKSFSVSRTYSSNIRSKLV